MANTSKPLSFTETEALLKNELKWSTPLFVMMVAVPFLGFFNLFNFFQDPPALWFQRSGSLMVMFGLLIEYTLFAINDDLFSTGALKPKDIKLIRKYRLQFSFMKYLGLIGAISGTVIWGYGDLFWTALN